MARAEKRGMPAPTAHKGRRAPRVPSVQPAPSAPKDLVGCKERLGPSGPKDFQAAQGRREKAERRAPSVRADQREPRAIKETSGSLAPRVHVVKKGMRAQLGPKVWSVRLGHKEIPAPLDCVAPKAIKGTRVKKAPKESSV